MWFFVQLRHNYSASLSLTQMSKISLPNTIKMPPRSSESQLYFSLRSTWPRGLCLIKFPHPWEKSSTLLHPFYNPPVWPEGLSPGQADHMCIRWRGRNVMSEVALQTGAFLYKCTVKRLVRIYYISMNRMLEHRKAFNPRPALWSLYPLSTWEKRDNMIQT